MWISKLFGKTARIDRVDEPGGGPLHERGMVGRLAKRKAADQIGRHIDGQTDASGQEGAILGLLGSHLQREGEPLKHGANANAGAVDANNLLGALYTRYCKALDAPQSLMSDTWSPSALHVQAGLRTEDIGAQAWDREAGGAISGIFPDIESVDQAFGVLKEHSHSEVAPRDAIPEILRLFAPPEYKAEARHATKLPPALTRREHHMLAIDSPLADLNGSSNEQDELTA